MRKLALPAILLGLVVILASLACAVTGDQGLALPFAVDGAGLLIGGALLASKK